MIDHKIPSASEIVNGLACSNSGSDCDCGREIKPGTWRAHCPAHDDGTPSFDITRAGNGKVLVKCHAGCSQEAVINALRDRGLWPSRKDGPGPTTGGLSLAGFAKAKKLDPSLLRQSHVTEAVGKDGKPYVVFNYLDADGKALPDATRFRFSMDSKPKAKRGGAPALYGLWRLPEFRPGGWLILVEGESDCLTAWTYGLPAVGIPGKGLLKTLDPELFAGFTSLYVWQEPDAPELPGKAAARLRQVDGLAVFALIPPDGIKDLSEAHLSGADVAALVDRLRQEAAPAVAPKPGRPAKEKKTDTQAQPVRQTSFFAANGFLYEQILADGRPAFLRYEVATGKTEVVASFQHEGDVHEPVTGDEIDLGAIKLPVGVAEYGSTADLLKEAELHIFKYLDVSPTYLKLAACYVLLTWAYDRFNTLPYLRALGDTGTGKSRFLDVIGGICYKPISASGCVTPAPIYRLLRKWGGTLILDEADIKNSDEYNEITTILNCGFERGRPVLRAVKDNPDRLQVLPVYGPKIFATRRRFKDVALEARCLTEITRETQRADIPAVLGSGFRKEEERLRQKLLLWRLRNYQKIDPEGTSNINLSGVEPRLRQVADAFGALFAKDPEASKSFESFIKKHQRELIEERAATLTGRIVFELINFWRSAVTHVTDIALVTDVSGNRYLSLTAAEIAENIGLIGNDGKPQSRVVGSILSGLGLRTKPVKTAEGTKRLIPCDDNLLDSLRKRYVADEEPAGGSDPVTLCTSVTCDTGDREKKSEIEINLFEGEF